MRDRTEINEVFLKTIQKEGVLITLPKGTILCDFGEIPQYVYYIIKGTVVSFTARYTTDENYFNAMSEGSFFFYTTAIKAHPMNHSFKTITEATLIKIDKNKFLKILESNNDICLNFLYMVTDDYLAAMKRHRERSSYPVAWRVCNYLLNKQQEGSYEYSGRIIIKEKVSQQTIANFIQANRVSVARSIKDLKAMGLLDSINGHYSINDTDKFIKYMELIS